MTILEAVLILGFTLIQPKERQGKVFFALLAVTIAVSLAFKLLRPLLGLF
jgi:hypothetical protein